jgi:hypothetical protein
LEMDPAIPVGRLRERPLTAFDPRHRATGLVAGNGLAVCASAALKALPPSDIRDMRMVADGSRCWKVKRDDIGRWVKRGDYCL